MKGVKQLEVPLRQLAKRGTKLTSVEICCGSSAPAKRDYAMRASLFGCGLRRSELVRLKVVEIQEAARPLGGRRSAR
jgi:integrase